MLSKRNRIVKEQGHHEQNWVVGLAPTRVSFLTRLSSGTPVDVPHPVKTQCCLAQQRVRSRWLASIQRLLGYEPSALVL